MGISALKLGLRNSENLLRNWRKQLENQEFTHYVFLVNISDHPYMYNIIENAFCERVVFYVKIKLKLKLIRFWFLKFTFIVLLNFSTVFCRYLREVCKLTISRQIIRSCWTGTFINYSVKTRLKLTINNITLAHNSDFPPSLHVQNTWWGKGSRPPYGPC